MIIGNGFIAKHFQSYHNNPYIIIYASGVPNIANYSEEKADREKQLLEKTILNNKSCKIIYFSSCGIYDKNNFNSYSVHKLNMENIIKNLSDNFLIFRLPITIGKKCNNNNLCQYFYNLIKNNEKFTIWDKAYRYLIDIKDVSNIVKLAINKKCFNNDVINISSSKKIRVTKIVGILETFLNKKAIYNLINKESNYNINICKLKEILPDSTIYEDNYAYKTLKKYYCK